MVHESIVGRDGELATLVAFVDASSHRPMKLLLEGSAGVGKTTLWRHAVGVATDCGFTVLQARPTEAEARMGFSGVGDLLRPFDERLFAQIPAPQRRALEIALFLRDADGPPPDAHIIGVAVLAAVQVLARERSVLIAVDDLPWMDAPSRLVLDFLARRLRTEHVGVLATSRPGQSTSLGTTPDRIALGPLSVGATHHMLRTKLGVTFPRPVLRRLHAASGGNALFALELADAMQEVGQIAPGDFPPVPHDLRELLRAKIDLLPSRSRAPLLAIALLSQPTEALILGALGAAAEPGLEEAAHGSIIELDNGRIRFAHPLLSSVLLGQVTRHERQDIHRRLAGCLSDPEERAWHLGLASEGPDPAAADALDDAAHRAASRGAPDTAADLSELAIRLTEHPSTTSGKRRLTAAEHHMAAGNLERARQLLKQGIATTAPGPLRARMWQQLAATVQGDLEEEASAHRSALAEPGISEVLRGEILHGLAHVFTWSGDVQTGLRLVEESAAALEGGDDRRMQAMVLGSVSTFELWAGREPRLEVQQRALELERALDAAGAPMGYDCRPSFEIGRQAIYRADYDTARSLLDPPVARVDRLTWEEASNRRYFLAALELRAGRWKDAARHAASGYDLDSQAGANVAGCCCIQAHLEVLVGDVDNARTTLVEARESAAAWGHTTFMMYAQAVSGLLELALGNAVGACPDLVQAQEDFLAQSIDDPLFATLSCMPEAIEALALTGRLDEAERWLAWLEKASSRVHRPWVEAVAARCRGHVLASRNDIDGALAAFEESRRTYRSVAQPFERARTELAYGMALRRAKQRRKARTALAEAKSTFESLGARLWTEQALTELGRVSGRSASGLSLTPTEERVASLVAEGLTNREVASTLFVAERTVEGHLSRIYAKLSVRSRVELSRLLTRGSA